MSKALINEIVETCSKLGWDVVEPDKGGLVVGEENFINEVMAAIEDSVSASIYQLICKYLQNNNMKSAHFEFSVGLSAEKEDNDDLSIGTNGVVISLVGVDDKKISMEHLQ